jgi:hypothetical protein
VYQITYQSADGYAEQNWFVEPLLSKREVESLLMQKPRGIYFRRVVPMDCEHALAQAEVHGVKLYVIESSRNIMHPATLENMLKLKAQLLNE